MTACVSLVTHYHKILHVMETHQRGIPATTMVGWGREEETTCSVPVILEHFKLFLFSATMIPSFLYNFGKEVGHRKILYYITTCYNLTNYLTTASSLKGL